MSGVNVELIGTIGDLSEVMIITNANYSVNHYGFKVTLVLGRFYHRIILECLSTVLSTLGYVYIDPSRFDLVFLHEDYYVQSCVDNFGSCVKGPLTNDCGYFCSGPVCYGLCLECLEMDSCCYNYLTRLDHCKASLMIFQVFRILALFALIYTSIKSLLLFLIFIPHFNDGQTINRKWLLIESVMISLNICVLILTIVSTSLCFNKYQVDESVIILFSLYITIQTFMVVIKWYRTIKTNYSDKSSKEMSSSFD